MQLISKNKKGFHFFLFIIQIFNKYAWVAPLEDKKSITIINAFQKVLNESNQKPSKIWVDKGSEFYNRSMKSWLQDNDIKKYSTHNEENSAISERFVRTLKEKIYKYLTPISKNVYIDKLDDTVNKYSNTYHRTIKMRPVDVKSNTYIDFNVEKMIKILNLKLLIM